MEPAKPAVPSARYPSAIWPMRAYASRQIFGFFFTSRQSHCTQAFGSLLAQDRVRRQALLVQKRNEPRKSHCAPHQLVTPVARQRPPFFGRQAARKFLVFGQCFLLRFLSPAKRRGEGECISRRSAPEVVRDVAACGLLPAAKGDIAPDRENRGFGGPASDIFIDNDPHEA